MLSLPPLDLLPLDALAQNIVRDHVDLEPELRRFGQQSLLQIDPHPSLARRGIGRLVSPTPVLRALARRMQSGKGLQGHSVDLFLSGLGHHAGPSARGYRAARFPSA